MYSNRASILLAANTLWYGSNTRLAMSISQTASPLVYWAVSQWANQPTNATCLCFLFILAYCVPLRAANNCRWLYTTMSAINGIIFYILAVCFFLMLVRHFSLFPITLYLLQSLTNSFRIHELFRRWQMHNCIIINWWPLISGRFIGLSVPTAAHAKHSRSEISLNYSIVGWQLILLMIMCMRVWCVFKCMYQFSCCTHTQKWIVQNDRLLLLLLVLLLLYYAVWDCIEYRWFRLKCF